MAKKLTVKEMQAVIDNLQTEKAALVAEKAALQAAAETPAENKARRPRRQKVATVATPARVTPCHLGFAKNGLSASQAATITRISLQFSQWCSNETTLRTDGSKCAAGLSKWQLAVDTDGGAHKASSNGKGADMLYLCAKDFVLHGVKHNRHTFMAEHRFAPSASHCLKIEKFLASPFFKG